MADSLRKAQGRAFGLSELGTLLELPQSFNLACRYVAKSRKIGGMSGTILAPRGAADHVHEEGLKARIKLARANNDYRGELGEGGQQFRVARHDQHTVWHEAHNSLRDREDGIELFGVLTARRSDLHVRFHLGLAHFMTNDYCFKAALLCPCAGYFREIDGGPGVQPSNPISPART